MSTHPEDGSCVIIVPRGTFVNSEKAPWVFVVSVLLLALGSDNQGNVLIARKLNSLFRHKDSHSRFFSCSPADVLLPDYTEEHRPSAIHDCDVRKRPPAIVGLEIIDYAQEKWVLRDRAHGIVGDTSGCGFSQPGGVREQRV